MFAAQQLEVTGKGQRTMRRSVPGGALMQQPAHGIVRQDPAIELLAYQLGLLAAQHPAATQQVGLELIKDGFDLPALVIQSGQLQRGRLVGIQQGRLVDDNYLGRSTTTILAG